MEEIHRLKEEILKDYPRLSEDSEFSFSCHPGVACFNRCCADVNIFLTPYDVLRLKGALKMSSREFLKKHTIVPFDKNLKYPVFLLKMEENEGKTCPFVGEKGCGVYRDRPWSCRMYPVGLASPKEGGAEAQKEFYFLLKESCCQGFGEDRKLTVGEWLEAQGVLEYDEMGREWKALTLHKYFLDGNDLPPAKVEMFFMACYDGDKFREFLFESSFFKKFEVDEACREKLRTDDVELLRFGCRWLRFALFGEKTMTVKGPVLEAKKKSLRAKDGAPPSRN